MFLVTHTKQLYIHNSQIAYFATYMINVVGHIVKKEVSTTFFLFFFPSFFSTTLKDNLKMTTAMMYSVVK